MGFLHCSVIDSLDVDAFARSGNAFGGNQAGAHASHNYGERDFGAYELAPPPERVWADSEDNSGEDVDGGVEMDDALFFEDEEEEELTMDPMMPWYEQVDAVIATFPKMGNGPLDDNSVKARLSGLQWLATQGLNLPPGVERILVLDATDLRDIPLQNTDPNLAPFVDIEAFWKSDGRKKPRLLLRHSSNAAAEAASRAASVSAEKASSAALRAKEAYESGDAELAAECAVECQQAALASMETIRQDVENMQNLRKSLTDLGVKVETIKGGEPIDVMTHLGQRSGYESIVWHVGCWGNRGVKAILSGAFQWVSAHLAVDAAGGKFWQLMLAESAVQAACGPESSVMVMAEQEDISLEYCDENDDDEDCVLSVDGRAIRHVRLDCRAVLVDPERERVLKGPKMSKLDNVMLEEAPWFI